jgi:hypothetical protein
MPGMRSQRTTRARPLVRAVPRSRMGRIYSKGNGVEQEILAALEDHPSCAQVEQLGHLLFARELWVKLALVMTTTAAARVRVGHRPACIRC